MSENNEKKSIGKVVIEFFTKEEVDNYESVANQAIINNTTIDAMVNDFFAKNAKTLGFTPLGEQDMAAVLRVEGTVKSHLTLKKYREEGYLLDEKGKPTFYENNNGDVIYNKEETIKFFQRNEKDPVIKRGRPIE